MQYAHYEVSAMRARRVSCICGTATAAKKLEEVAVIQYPTFPLPPRAASATPARAGCLQAALPPRTRRALRGGDRDFARDRRGRSPTDDSFSASARAPDGPRR